MKKNYVNFMKNNKNNRKKIMFIRKIGCTFSDGSESFVYISCLSFILCMENVKEGIFNGKRAMRGNGGCA